MQFEDRHEFETFVKSYSSHLLATARRHTGDSEAANDLLQDTFVKVLPPKWEVLVELAVNDLHLLNIVKLIMHRLWHDEGRRRRSRRASNHVGEDAVKQLAVPPRDLDLSLDLDNAIQSLPADQQELFDLFCRQEMTGDEIVKSAPSHGSRPTVYRKVGKAKDRLRGELGGDYLDNQ